MSGIVFLLCCGTVTNSGAAIAVESCPLAKMGDCDKAAGKDSPPAKEILQPGDLAIDGFALNCCAFLPQIFDKVRKVEKNPQIADVPQRVSVDSPAFLPIKGRQKSFFEYCPPLLSRQGAYLKNRVFRI